MTGAAEMDDAATAFACPDPSMRVLVANRGEIARRVIRSTDAWGVASIAVYAEPDATAPFVAEASLAEPIGPAALADSYLSIDALLAAAERSGATHVHPGYGFLAENADFASAVVGAGLIWVGPTPELITLMGSKIRARSLAAAAGVPIIPGFNDSQDDDALAAAAERIGYPVLVKASAGGGGKGIRIAHEPDGFGAALAEARTEAQRAFGDGDVIVERYVQRPRHVEVQVVGDKHGTVVELGTRECSVQRRYQKVLEEAPAPNLAEATRTGLRAAARDLAGSLGYDSVGTVEFIVDDDTGEYFFLEMNTRIQVEHTVTEMVCGLDLIQLQLLVANGGHLPIAADHFDRHLRGAAVEVRVNAEDPWADFAPRIGRVEQLVVPPDCRWDGAVVQGSEVSPHYDSMIGKLIAHGADRDGALATLDRALGSMRLAGLTTNLGFLRWLVAQPPVLAGRITTRFLDESDLPEPVDVSAAALAAASAWFASSDTSAPRSGVWSAGPLRLTPAPIAQTVAVVQNGETYTFPRTELSPGSPADEDAGPGTAESDAPLAVTVDRPSRTCFVDAGLATFTFAVPTRSERWAPSSAGRSVAGAVVAPFPGLVTDLGVAVGDEVEAGATLITIEAMKMLHPVTAAGSGTIAEIRVAVGDQVAADQVLVVFAEAE